MKQIKYRCWDADNQKMLYGIEPGYSNKEYLAAKMAGKPDNRFLMLRIEGRTDINGELIYQDDIVKVINHGPDFITTIQFNGLAFFLHPDYEARSLEELLDRNRIEVIGNKHQNPELER